MDSLIVSSEQDVAVLQIKIIIIITNHAQTDILGLTSCMSF